MNTALAGAIAVIVASLLWSLDGFLRVSLYSLPPTVVVFWEHVFGFVVLAPVILVTLRKFKAVTKRQWAAIALVAFLSGALGTIFYTAALGSIQYIDFSVVVLLQKLQPIFAILAAAVLLREPLTKRFVGLAIAAIGAAYFVSFPDLTVTATPAGTVTAALFAVGAAVCWGISTAFSKYALQDTSFLHITAARFGLTPLFALLLVFIMGSSSSLLTLQAPQWWTIVSITLSTGLVALAIYYYGLKRIPASRSTILELMWPLSAMVIGYFFLGDRLTFTQIVGAIVLVVSMLLVAQDAKKVTAHTAKEGAA